MSCKYTEEYRTQGGQFAKKLLNKLINYNYCTYHKKFQDSFLLKSLREEI